MLEGLDGVEWACVCGPYGPVAEMPQHVRALASSDAAAFDTALGWLYSNLIHQGTRFHATPTAVPFLLEVLAGPGTLHRERVLLLILDLIVEGGVPPVPHGFDPDVAFAEAHAARLDPADVREVRACADWEALDDRLRVVADFMPAVDHHDAYCAVERGAGLIMNLTADPEPAVRRAAVWAVGWFPAVAREGMPHVRAAVEREADPYLLANALMMLGLLARYLGDRADVPVFEAYLRRDRPRVVRRAAAITLGTVLGDAAPAGVLDVLMEGAEDDVNLKADTEGLGWPWAAPSLKGSFWRVIHAMGL